ncbi:MAG: hypothetical protein JWO38_6504 [Gemmataceae bacterium]|nr:hypothetical protein [Gemmataceae bacterium]
MTIRVHLAAAALCAGLVASPLPAAETAKKPAYGFSTLKAADVAAARAKAEAWLKSVGKFDQIAFDKVWNNEGRSVLDRVADTISLGNSEAAALLETARKADSPAAAQVPGLLKDAKQDVFFRANLALAFAKANATKKAYEEALEALNGVSPEQVVDPATYFFFKAVSEHATTKRDAAVASINRLLDDVAETPDRYRMVATLMFFDIVNWSPDPKDLTNIERLMDNSGRRLDLARPGEKTQDIQKKIVFRLDEVIKEMENQCKGGQCNGGACPNGGKPGNKPGSTINPSNPAQDSMLMGGSGPGKVDEQKLRKYAEGWGNLPPGERAKIVEEVTRDLPAKYKPMIDEYFKSLNRIHGLQSK